MGYRMDAELAGVKTIHLIVHLHQSCWVTRCIVIEQQSFEKNFFFLSLRLQHGIKNTQ